MTAVKQRKSHLDFLRILAAFLVIYNHTRGYHYYLSYTGTPAEMFSTILLSSFTRINVPLFFMISGALLLGKEETYRTIFNKRILRFILVLFFASFLLYASGDLQSFRILDFIKAVVTCNVSEAYWFLYTYLGFLVSLPFLRKIAKVMTGKEFLLLVVCRVVFFGVPAVLSHCAGMMGWEYVSITGNFSLPFSNIDFIFYSLVGYYLENVLSSVSIKKYIPLCVAVIFAGTLLSAGITYQLYVREVFTQNYLGVFCYLSAIAMFLIAKYVFEKWNTKIQGHLPERVLTCLSSLTLGIYLIDPFVGNRMYLFWEMDRWAEGRIHWVPLSLIYCVISVAIGSFVTWNLKQVPIFKKYL